MRTLWELAKQSLTPSQNEAEFRTFKSTLQHRYYPILPQYIYLRFTTILLCTEATTGLDQISQALTYLKFFVFLIFFLSPRAVSFDNILLLSVGYLFLAPILFYCYQAREIGICWLCLCLMLSDKKYFIAYFFTGGLCLRNYLCLLLFLCFRIRDERELAFKRYPEWLLLFMIIDFWKDWRTILVVVLIQIIIATDRYFRHNKRSFSDYCEIPTIQQYY